MSSNRPEDVLRVLDEANQCHNVIWQWWVYMPESNVLVLGAVRPGIPELVVDGYLVFRSPQYVRLPRGVVNAEFKTGPSPGASEPLPLPTGVDPVGLYDIEIHSGEHAFRVICRGVDFYSRRKV
jgi:hypothetical protein